MTGPLFGVSPAYTNRNVCVVGHGIRQFSEQQQEIKMTEHNILCPEILDYAPVVGDQIDDAHATQQTK